ncbi:MAG: hypothetical protein IKD01_02535 [Oscillospiraceae bacterium]|nr:hypothetical protein [Oscillospiraceae bacterium]
MPYLAVTPTELPKLPKLRIPLAHVAYAVGDGGHLVAAELPRNLRGGVMVLSDRCCGPLSNYNALCRGILNECNLRRFSGVLADFEGAMQQDRHTFLAQLADILTRSGRKLYVPEHYAVENACVLICTAISGGTLRERLADAKRHYGSVALDCTRLMMDFPLPCRSGNGKPLDAEELSSLARRSGMPSFFSSELGANYFTLCDRGQGHFILFDTAQTLRQKLQLGEELGYETAFFMYPEVCDLLGELF